jgi:hypothetical protein
MSLDALRHLKLDHSRPVGEMTGEEALQEYLFLESGYAENSERRGVCLGLSPTLERRRQELKRHITACINFLCPVSLGGTW